jgi:hypothetical protein
MEYYRNTNPTPPLPPRVGLAGPARVVGNGSRFLRESFIKKRRKVINRFDLYCKKQLRCLVFKLHSSFLLIIYSTIRVVRSEICVVIFFLIASGSCYVTQIGLKLTILLPQPPECWNYKNYMLCMCSNS